MPSLSFIITGTCSDRGDQNTESISSAAPEVSEGSDDDSNCAVDLSCVDFGACAAAFTVNDRLMVIRTQHRSVDASVCKSELHVHVHV